MPQTNESSPTPDSAPPQGDGLDVRSFSPRYTADGRGMLRRDAGVYVLHLQGSDADLARQHGELLAAEIREGAIPFMARYLPGQVHEGSLPGPLSWLARRSLALLTAYLGARLPKAHRRTLGAMAQGADLPVSLLEQALGVVDGLPILMDTLFRVFKLQVATSTLGAWSLARRGWGCSGVVALAEATQSGHVLHGRNLDYDGMGFWDRFPLVAFCRPEDGQPYAFISSAGAHTAALTAMNASGLFLGSNTAPTTDVSLRGAPFFVVNENALRQARTVGEAVALLQNQRPVSGYNVHLSHPDGEAAVVEYSHARSRVRLPERGLLVATNHYVHPEMAVTSPDLPIVDLGSSVGRYERLMDRLQRERGALSVELVVDCLRDQVEHRAGEARPGGDVVLNFYNLLSVVADVTERRFWVAADEAPSALGRYVLFDLPRELESFGKARAYPMDVQPASSEGANKEAVGHLLCAHLALTRRGDLDEAMAALEAGHQAAPEDGRFCLDLALLALHRGDGDSATRQARRFLGLAPDAEPRRYRGHLALAWSHDLAGRSAEADVERARAEVAAQALRSDDPRGARAALFEVSVWRGKPLERRDCPKMQIDLYNSRRLG